MSETMYHTACTECGAGVGYSWKPLQQPEHLLCYACMEDIGIVSAALGLNDLLNPDLFRLAGGPRSNEWQIGRAKLLRVRDKAWDTYVAKATAILHANKNKP